MNPNVAKGLLVLLVVVDHNDFSRQVFPEFLYGLSFHVVGFMALPFLRPALAPGVGLRDYAFRIYYPYVVFVTLLALVVAVIAPVPALQQAQNWLISLYSGNSDILKETTHLAMLWYLPSFVALVVMHSLVSHAPAAARALLVAVLVIAHVFVGTVPESAYNYLPLGILPAIYVFPLALGIVALHEKVMRKLPRAAGLTLATAAYVIAKWFQMRAHLYNEVGFASVADFSAPLALVLNDMEAICGVLMVLQISRFNLLKLVGSAGKYSLQVYLLHVFVALAVYKLVSTVNADWPAVLSFLASIGCTALATIFIARRVAEDARFQALLFPRTPAEPLRYLSATPLMMRISALLSPSSPGSHD